MLDKYLEIIPKSSLACSSISASMPAVTRDSLVAVSKVNNEAALRFPKKPNFSDLPGRSIVKNEEYISGSDLAGEILVPQDQPQRVGTLLRRDFTPVAAFRLYRSINSFENRIKKSDTKSSDKRKAPVDETGGGGGGAVASRHHHQASHSR